jgi:hypothetical protein
MNAILLLVASEFSICKVGVPRKRNHILKKKPRGKKREKKKKESNVLNNLIIQY